MVRSGGAATTLLSGQFKTEVGMIGRYKQWLGMMTKAYPEAKVYGMRSSVLNSLMRFSLNLRKSND